MGEKLDGRLDHHVGGGGLALVSQRDPLLAVMREFEELLLAAASEEHWQGASAQSWSFPRWVSNGRTAAAGTRHPFAIVK